MPHCLLWLLQKCAFFSYSRAACHWIRLSHFVCMAVCAFVIWGMFRMMFNISQIERLNRCHVLTRQYLLIKTFSTRAVAVAGSKMLTVVSIWRHNNSSVSHVHARRIDFSFVHFSFRSNVLRRFFRCSLAQRTNKWQGERNDANEWNKKLNLPWAQKVIFLRLLGNDFFFFIFLFVSARRRRQ